MGGCAGTQYADEDVGDCKWAELSNLYDQRFVESLGAKVEKKTTRPDNVDALPVETDLLPGYRAHVVDDKQPRQTIFFLNWDDTLFPTTWAQSVPSWTKHEERLKKISMRMVHLLNAAQTAGKVVIVTNGSRSWVASCCAKLMPEAQATLKRIPFIHAMELFTATEVAQLPTKILYTEAKARAMRTILATFSRSSSEVPGTTMHVVSIGDSDCDHIATRELARGKLHGKPVPGRCFTKAVKTMRRPSFTQVLLQLSVISKWFAEIVHVDTHISIDLGKQHV